MKNETLVSEPMDTINIASMNHDELKSFVVRAQAKINEANKKIRTDAARAVEDLLCKHGFSLADIIPLLSDTTGPQGRVLLKSKGSRKPAKKKFINPHELGMVWSGRGRTPKWFSENIKAGMSEQDMMIDRTGPDTA